MLRAFFLSEKMHKRLITFVTTNAVMIYFQMLDKEVKMCLFLNVKWHHLTKHCICNETFMFYILVKQTKIFKVLNIIVIECFCSK